MTTSGGDVVFESTLLESKMLDDVGAEQVRRFVGGAYAGLTAGSAGAVVPLPRSEASTTSGGDVVLESTLLESKMLHGVGAEQVQTTSPAYRRRR